VIVDSSALVALLLAEAGSEALERALIDNPGGLVPAPSYLEVCMVVSGRFGADARPRIDRLLDALDLRIHPFTELHAREAVAAFLRYGKGRHAAGLNFGDCMAYAVAQAEGAPLMFTGDDFAKTDVARWDE
jgi:ribonuclease VapC